MAFRKFLILSGPASSSVALTLIPKYVLSTRVGTMLSASDAGMYNSQHLKNAYPVRGLLLTESYALFHLIFFEIARHGIFCTLQKRKLRRSEVKSPSQLTKRRGENRIRFQTVGLQMPLQ